MTNRSSITIKKATVEEDFLIARHFDRLWIDNNFSSDIISEDWQEKTLNFIVKARENLSFQAFIAVIDNQIVGSASCQLFAGLYPIPFKADFRNYGYIWNVYVEADYRRQGIATKLTQEAIKYLHFLNCTHAILHASPHGKPIYESLGFVPKNEMILELK